MKSVTETRTAAAAICVAALLWNPALAQDGRTPTGQAGVFWKGNDLIADQPPSGLTASDWTTVVLTAKAYQEAHAAEIPYPPGMSSQMENDAFSASLMIIIRVYLPLLNPTEQRAYFDYGTNGIVRVNPDAAQITATLADFLLPQSTALDQRYDALAQANPSDPSLPQVREQRDGYRSIYWCFLVGSGLFGEISAKYSTYYSQDSNRKGYMAAVKWGSGAGPVGAYRPEAAAARPTAAGATAAARAPSAAPAPAFISAAAPASAAQPAPPSSGPPQIPRDKAIAGGMRYGISAAAMQAALDEIEQLREEAASDGQAPPQKSCAICDQTPEEKKLADAVNDEQIPGWSEMRILAIVDAAIRAVAGLPVPAIPADDIAHSADIESYYSDVVKDFQSRIQGGIDAAHHYDAADLADDKEQLVPAMGTLKAVQTGLNLLRQGR